MRPARHRSSIAVTVLAAAALLAACAQPDAAPTPSTAQGKSTTSVAELPAGPVAAGHPESPVTPAGAADACTGCGADGADETAQAPALRRVASAQVCMRSNRFMAKAQPSTDVDGRAYFGCCAGCTKHLGENAAARTAKDPVTGNAVDKAAAVIGARPDGSVVYFESEETFTRAGGA